MAIQNQTSITGLVKGANQRFDPGQIDSQAAIFQAASYSNFDLYAGGFVGMTDDGLTTITDDINTLIINPINDILDGFGGGDDVFDPGLKGKANQAATQYIAAIKQLLGAYISTYKSFIELATETNKAMHDNDTTNASLINDAASDIQKLASEIRVD